LITVPGLINLDFADVRAIMSQGGAALMAVGSGTGDDRARLAAEQAVSSRLLDVTIDGARGILFNITGGTNMSLFEVNQAAAIIRDTAHPDANLIFGAVIDEEMGDELRITVIATGFERAAPRRQALPPHYSRAESGPAANRPAAASPAEPAPSQPVTQPVQPRFAPNNLDIPAFLRRR
jgi:cell division protein FtsZ